MNIVSDFYMDMYVASKHVLNGKIDEASKRSEMCKSSFRLRSGISIYI